MLYRRGIYKYGDVHSRDGNAAAVTYIKNESVPVFNEAGEEMKPGISAIAGAVKDAGKTVVCPYCGSANGADDNFCSKCGKALVFTCPRCNAKVSADSAFCPKCGEKL